MTLNQARKHLRTTLDAVDAAYKTGRSSLGPAHTWDDVYQLEASLAPRLLAAFKVYEDAVAEFTRK